MSDDPSSPSAAADLPSITVSDAHHSQIPASEASVSYPSNHARRARNLQKRRQAQTKKRCEFMRDLQHNLDVMIYTELCILYYMDTSFIRLFIRSLAQVTFLTPKPTAHGHLRSYHHYPVAIFVPNIICIFLHLLTVPPEGSESARGYVHGGIIMDFIGEKGPASRLYMAALDVLILGLQCFMLALHRELANTKKLKRIGAASTSTVAAAATSAPATMQELDAEERGVLGALLGRGRSVGTAEGSESIEMNDLARDESALHTHNHESETNEEHNALLAEPDDHQLSSGANDDDDGPYDFSYTGMTVIGEFHVLQNLRNHWGAYDSLG